MVMLITNQSNHRPKTCTLIMHSMILWHSIAVSRKWKIPPQWSYNQVKITKTKWKLSFSLKYKLYISSVISVFTMWYLVYFCSFIGRKQTQKVYTSTAHVCYFGWNVPQLENCIYLVGWIGATSWKALTKYSYIYLSRCTTLLRTLVIAGVFTASHHITFNC